MQGFLDPAYQIQTPTNYRSVIDKVLVGTSPAAAYSFGSGVRPIQASLGTLAQRSFYSDKNTQLEDVIDSIKKDAGFSKAYVIVTDGRRGSPGAALAQYVALRTEFQRWVSGGGSVMVAVSMAPFSTVASDPSGCRQDGGGAEDQRCPLYAFAFAPSGAERWLSGVLASAFENLYSLPSVRAAGTEIELSPPTSVGGVQFEMAWGRTPKGTQVIRSRGNQPTVNWSALTIGVVNQSTPEAAGLLATIRGARTRVIIHARRFGAGPVGPWMLVDGAGSLLRPDPANPLAVDFVTHGLAAANSPTLYRVDLVPDGSPAWLPQFDASSATDQVRTFGLGPLFEAFVQDAKSLSADTGSIARFYVLAN